MAGKHTSAGKRQRENEKRERKQRKADRAAERKKMAEEQTGEAVISADELHASDTDNESPIRGR
jgi:hypothetical protein